MFFSHFVVAETTIAAGEKVKQDIQHYLTSFATDPNEGNRYVECPILF